MIDRLSLFKKNTNLQIVIFLSLVDSRQGLFVEVLDAPLLIELPTDVPGKAVNYSPAPWTTVTHVLDADVVPGSRFSQAQSLLFLSLGSEPGHRRSPSFSDSPSLSVVLPKKYLLKYIPKELYFLTSNT